MNKRPAFSAAAGLKGFVESQASPHPYRLLEYSQATINHPSHSRAFRSLRTSDWSVITLDGITGHKVDNLNNIAVV